MTIKVAIAGIAGRMGRTLAEMVHGADDLELVGGLERAGSPWLGQSIDAVLGLPAAKGDVLGDIAALPAFDVLLEQWPHARHVLVFVGPGNNGGDEKRPAQSQRNAATFCDTDSIFKGDVGKLRTLSLF